MVMETFLRNKSPDNFCKDLNYAYQKEQSGTRSRFSQNSSTYVPTYADLLAVQSVVAQRYNLAHNFCDTQAPFPP